MKSNSSLLFALLLPAVAAAAPDAGTSCAEVEQRLAASQRTLTACTEAGRSASAAHDRCEAQLRDSQERLGASASKAEACVTTNEQLCHEASVFVASALQGSARGIGSCVPQATQRKLQEQLDAWSAISKGLAQLDEYVSGASDLLPRVVGPTETERHLGRVLGVRLGTPLWNRRLLVTAFRLTAPNTWARLKAQGSVGIDAFFEAQGPLPEGFIAEAREEHDSAPGPAGPPLSAALKLTLSYLELSNCEERSGARDCRRARQLVELLDSAGPLIVRRRVEEMWATPCSTVNADTVRSWLQDFPTSTKEDALARVAELKAAARSKLFLCYLADLDGKASYRQWAAEHLPKPTSLDARTLPIVDGFASFVTDGDAVDRCGRAARALQQLEANGCGIAKPETLEIIGKWEPQPPAPTDAPELEVCSRVTSLLWSGATATIADAFTRPPTPAEMVRVDRSDSDSEVARLRTACDERHGTGQRFEKALLSLAKVARTLGESAGQSPWRLDGNGALPVEKARFAEAVGYRDWLQHTVDTQTACQALGLADARCAECRQQGPGHRYDCDLMFDLQSTWSGYRRATTFGVAALAAITFVVVWLLRLRRARREFAEPLRAAGAQLEGLGVEVSPDPWRWMLPSRNDLLRIELPTSPSWERWGARAVAVIAASRSSVKESDVNHAAAVALREDVHVAFLLHDDDALPELGAVRSTLDWAARGGSRAVQVLLLPTSRLTWATRDEDLLDLVETTTLRGNPFEVRGPIRSSSQFWNRERLVAGLLTEARTGNWVVVTGLRRFGKSSLALEVARRTPGPSAYVDLAGFHHEVGFGETPAVAVEAILRTLVMRLAESAVAQFPAATVPAVPAGTLDAPTLAAWLKQLGQACSLSSGNPAPPIVLVLDEIEQLLSTTPEKLGRALDVLATLVGRLRSAASEPSSPHSGHSLGVMMCGAIHPLLWAPLATLGGQSLMGAFPSICVPTLDDDAAHAMMRGLGAQQGIRFEDDALGLLVRASHGVPLLLRRLGTSVLELYDGDRARQGALGAVRIGIEGASEAVRREEQEGSPLRTWVESEIAQADTTSGLLLRTLARAERVPAAELRRLVEVKVMERFADSGLTAHLAPAEVKRRAQEAASVMVRVLADTQLLQKHGDLTSPDAYSLPEGVLRRILGGDRRS